MNNLERAQELADFATDHCRHNGGYCGLSSDGSCDVCESVKKCLLNDHIAAVYREEVYVVNRSYPVTDYRRYVFGGCSRPLHAYPVGSSKKKGN